MPSLKWKIAQHFELVWWKRHLKDQSVVVYLDKKKKYWKKVLELTNIHPLMDDSILDAGCGPSGMFTILYNHKVDALDPLLNKYTAELSHFKPDWYPNVNFYANTIESYSSNKLYDVIFCLNVINHVDQLEKSLEKLISLLKPEGRLLLSVDTHKWKFLKVLFQILPGDILHPHQYKLSDYLLKIEKANGVVQQTFLLKQHYIFDYHFITITKRSK
ncbi:MAG: class I SAM-dependent methyltransferase [Bacteroidota bacterium]